ncbi:MAG TPA: SDR family NAD(P)-dependent oxidoreductase, partial [Tahibacter sp.]|nr:SDR family NAD(P)-dependent oxidoreductase [Tahibacter sp.]
MRIWLITGASRGFGALIAQQALDHGDAVVATSRNAGDIALATADASRLLALSLDVTNEAQARDV